MNDNKLDYLKYATQKNTSADVTLRPRFEKVSSYEEKLGKDLSSFTVEEILSYYKEMESVSLEYLLVTNSCFASYCEWLGIRDNAFRKILKEDLVALVKPMSIVSREDVLRICNSLANPSDVFLVLGLFEGIYGKNFCELYWAQEDQYGGGAMKLYGGRVLSISKELATALHEACVEYVYIPWSEDAAPRDYDPDDKKAIKAMFNTQRKDDNVTDDIMIHRIKNKYDRIRYGVDDLHNVSAKMLRESGRIDMIKRLRGDGETVRQTILKNLEEIEYRYGKMSSIDRWLLKYEKNFE